MINDNIGIKHQEYVLSEKIIENPELFKEQIKRQEAKVRSDYPLDERIQLNL